MNGRRFSVTQTIKTEKNQRQNNEVDIDEIENSRSVCQIGNQRLNRILSRCELEIFDEPVQAVLRDIIERLYYSKQVTVSGATFPQAEIRNYLDCLNAETLTRAYNIIRNNTTPVKNVTAYLMPVVLIPL